MNFLIRPTDPCCCGSDKLYRNCCSSLTRLPKNPSPELRQRYWAKYINEVITVLLSVLDLGTRLDDARYVTENHTGIDKLRSIDEYDGLEVIDILALFHLPAYELVDEDEEYDEDDDTLTKDSPALALPLGILAAMAEGRFDKSPQRDVLRELMIRPFSWFEVVELVPGESLTLRDLIIDRQVVVSNKMLSENTNPGEFVCGKILEFEGISLIAGLFPMIFPSAAKPDIEKAKESLLEFIKEELDSELDSRSLLASAEEVVRLFVHIAYTQQAGLRPEIRNSDGDPFEMRDLLYSWTGSSVSQIADRITQVLGSLPDGSEPEIVAKDSSGQPTEITIRYVEAAPKDSAMDDVVVAIIEVKPEIVTVAVNSSRRAERLRQKLAPLDDILKFQDEVIHPPDDFDPAPSMQDFDSGSMPPEILEAVKEKFKGYQEKWLTLPIPALKGMTPLEAAKSDKMRPVLAALLDDFEQRDALAQANGNTINPLNVDELRKRLGFK